ncbi:HlyC/CorC family transporter [Rhodococcus sp. BP-349]|uniref:hemolysin family protein n=1 Tax=unclassified Rhodococcus (in: high G+C Gram-positive bacteria) TaxID=192944 RepID=UPI001C9B8A18|nr:MULTISPECIES: hemolysin family protein [unclassified Rhodococcus (in: high G+C Gram-positive bacteria)]MBY6541345.1 HlyC/CorC family transporter [Rhodococcus sp. BP-363]MBY6544629.1 HlyC/CorC family transporter [Rhodococcus sp. BP-369]MBY6563859.1 HlyC/CorC family transporter [Rhodococcus sp. BP-370]MBY6579204.1 HlyC/CorC family transporter [Rhodococcus sp. BP-364]MBY6588505.1 HlyC/CorC family transporter [Rhodococcus sp. BP-358]
MTVLVPILSLVGFVALTAGTAIFVAAEFSLTALERSTVDAAAREGDMRSRQVQHAHKTLSFQLSGAQLGITITTLITGYIAEPVLARFITPAATALGASDSLAGAVSLVLALVIATSASMVFGELVPKNMAISNPMKVARATAGLQAGFSLVFRWAINGLNGSANWVVRRLGVEPAEELRSARSPQELGSLVRSSAEHGSIDQRTALLVDRSLQFGERTAEELMTPRVKIETLAADDTVADLIDTAARTGFSRFPVVNGDLDDTVGIVHIKHAFTVPAERRAGTTVSSLAQRVPNVPSSLDGDTVMERVRADGMQVAIVVDEYGGTAGIVTMEDLIEEIVGDVRDEHDTREVDVQRVADGWLCSGLLRIDEVTEFTGYAAPEGEYDTLGGLVLTQFERIPDAGDQVILPPPSGDLESDEGGWVARVDAMDGRRIDRILVRPAAEDEIVRLRAETVREHDREALDG